MKKINPTGTNLIAFPQDQFNNTTPGGNVNPHSGLYFQTAYHGSGANFDKFDTAFMGTGEGRQAFGWGIYLSQKEGIARWYAELKKRNSAQGVLDPEFRINGKPIKEETKKLLNQIGNFYTSAYNSFTTFRNQQVVKGPISAKAGQNLWLLPFPLGNQAFLGLSHIQKTVFRSV